VRVALVTGSTDARRDGVAAYTLRLAEELRAAGVDAATVAVAPPHGARSVRAALHAAAGAHLVHVQWAPSLYRFRGAVGLAPHLTSSGARLVTTLHEYGGWSPERLRRVPERVWRACEAQRLIDRETLALVPRSAGVITTNAPHAAELATRFAGRVDAVTVPIGANVGVVGAVSDRDRERIRAEVRAELGVSADTTLVAFFGFVHPVKGVRHLADAITRLRAERAGAGLHLLVIGGFESMALPRDEADVVERELRAHLATSGADGATTITGFLPERDVSRLLTASDLGALPFTAGVTAKSGSLLTLLAHRLPVVVTDGGDPALADGVDCVVVDRVRDADALADGLRRLLDDPALRERVAAGGAALAEERSWPGIARAHLDLYRRVLA